MDIVVFIAGFIVGVVSVALAIEFGIKKTSKSEPASRSTRKWSISEISNPRIVAEYLGDVDIPKNSRIVVNKHKDDMVFAGVNAKINSGVRGNFILGDDRALILAGPVKKDEMGVWTVEKEILESLNNYFEETWSKGTEMKPPKK